MTGSVAGRPIGLRQLRDLVRGRAVGDFDTVGKIVPLRVRRNGKEGVVGMVRDGPVEGIGKGLHSGPQAWPFSISIAIITLLIGLALALIAAELILRYLQSHIQSSDRLDPGLMLHDRQLGWRMKPLWVGRHRHFDFDVGYTINQYGFRGDFPERKQGQDGRVYTFLGDSFTFGLGVDDRETFIHRLNARTGTDHSYLNFAVPGYSTDQELLLAKQRVFTFTPDVILLVVYLGNDLFDNELAFPLQANNAKPYFELEDDRLHLKNTPVPLQTSQRIRSSRI